LNRRTWKPEPGYDPLETAAEISNVVCRGTSRKYYRFRRTKFYGGCATADAVGCNLDCFYCYVNYPRRHPWDPRWKFYDPEHVARKLAEMSRGLRTARLSGCEPTLCPGHLIGVVETFERKAGDVTFVLETNGTLIGAGKVPLNELADVGNVHVRLCLKGCDERSFHEVTGADPAGFELQIRAIEKLMSSGVPFHVALPDVFTREEIEKLMELLVDLGLDPTRLEVEPITVYDHVLKEAQRRGVEWRLPNSASSSAGTTRPGTR